MNASPSRAFGFALLILCGLGFAQTPIANFLEETQSSGLNSRYDGDFMVGGGVAAFDCDDNGLPDLLLSGGSNRAKFYRNLSPLGGALKFREEAAGLEADNVIGAYPLDVDGDGKTDVVLLRAGEKLLMRGLGNCRFERANEAWGFRSDREWTTAFSATWERGQEWPTLAFGNYINRETKFPWGSCKGNALYRPFGKGYAAPIPLEPSYCALSMLFSDWNRSGTPSLRISNDREYYAGKGQEQLWQIVPGQPPRLFAEAEGWKRLQIWGMGIASYDLLGQGYPVYFLSSMGDNKLQALQAGAKGPIYSDIAFRRGATAHRPYTGGDVHMSTAWHAQFEDVNNDGLIDLFVAKGNVGFMKDAAAKDPNNLLLGQPDGSFQEAGDKAGLASFLRGRGAQVVDLNADGLLDVVVVNRLDDAQVWRNVGAGSANAPKPLGNWLQIRLRQPGGNRDAVGAWLEVQLGDRILRREHTIGGGHASGGLGFLHFGLGRAETVRVRVQWPGGEWGDWQELKANQFIVLDRASGAQPYTPRSTDP
ncbi:MAG TPA: CRTAC1 family protein [Meiothermus sp.]|nr:CRTAC1 family protein [Meiothermus sp.]